jgi:DNA-binding transcriptional ArsR family regulator
MFALLSGVPGLFPRLPTIISSILASGDQSSSGGYRDPRFRRILWYLIGSTKGGVNRARIIDLINNHPANPNQIASELTLDYKTVIHHLRVLSENGLVITDNRVVRGDLFPESYHGEKLRFVQRDNGQNWEKVN